MKETGFSRVSKNLIITELEKEIKSHSIFFIADHSSIPAAMMDKLRAKLRGSKGRYLVVKNTLGRRAFEGAKLAGVSETISGACGVAFSSGDPVTSSKILVDFAKENEGFKIRSGWMDGRLLGLEDIRALASLPSREVLLTRLVSSMQSPISRFAGVLAGTLRKAVTVLDAIAKQKGGK
ncbi:MAG: 50S ribosomal protein L10 [Candidatus Omnitrophica bacterium]|nr:50S ribosomal protein L10 [Candidatus Omnitrophota bacterium]